MKHFTSTIPLDLAEKLQKKGMPISKQHLRFARQGESKLIPPTFGACFDWLMEKGKTIFIEPHRGENTDSYLPFVNNYGLDDCPTWHEAANAAIEKVVTLL